MKKFMSVIAAMSVISMQCIPLQITAVAEESANISLDVVSAEPGESIDLALTISNNPGIIATSVTIEYDTSCLSLKSVDDSALFSGASFTTSGDMSITPFRVMWEDGLSKSNYTDNGTLAVFHFDVLDTASYGTYEINVEVENENTFDINLDEVEFTITDGSVIIEDSSVETETTTSTETTTETETTTSTETTTETETTTSTETTTETETTTSTETTTETETTTSTETTTETETTTSTETTTETETTTSTETETETEPESETTSTETITETETTTTARTYIASVSELRDMAKKDYKSRTGIYPDNATSEFKSNGFLNISLYDEDGNILDIYTIDPYSGVGISESGYGIELPQTGNNSVKTIAGTVSALALMISGAFAMNKSGIISRKRKNKENE